MDVELTASEEIEEQEAARARRRPLFIASDQNFREPCAYGIFRGP